MVACFVFGVLFAGDLVLELALGGGNGTVNLAKRHAACAVVQKFHDGVFQCHQIMPFTSMTS